MPRTYAGGLDACRRTGISRRRTPPNRVRSFAQIRVSTPAMARRDVKTFRPRCGPVVVAPACARRHVGASVARARVHSPPSSRVLISSVFSSVAVHARRPQAGAQHGLRAGIGTRRRQQQGCRKRGGCENFSRGLLTVKKTVIRFRLSRPCLPNRVRRINRPMRSSPSKTTAILKTVDMAPLPPEKCKVPPVPMPAPPIVAGIAASVTARLTRRRSPQAAWAGLIHLGVSTPYH